MSQGITLTKEGLNFKGKLYPFGDCEKFATKLKKDELGVIVKKLGVPFGTKKQICSHLKAKAGVGSAVSVAVASVPAVALTKKGLEYKGVLYSLENCAQFAKAKITKKDLEVVCQMVGCNAKAKKEDICKALKAKLLSKSPSVPSKSPTPTVSLPKVTGVVIQQGQIKFDGKTVGFVKTLEKFKVADLRRIADSLTIDIKGLKKDDLVKHIKTKVGYVPATSPVISIESLVYDSASDSVHVKGIRFRFGTNDLLRAQLNTIAKALGVTIDKKDTVKSLYTKLHQTLRAVKQKKKTPAVALPPPSPSPAKKAKTPTPTPSPPKKAKTPTPPSPKQIPLKKMTDQEIRDAIRKCLNLS